MWKWRRIPLVLLKREHNFIGQRPLLEDLKKRANSKKIDDIPEEDPIIQKAVSKIYQISEIDEVQLKVIEEALEESKRLDWQDDIIEKARQEAQEKIQEKAIKCEKVV